MPLKDERVKCQFFYWFSAHGEYPVVLRPYFIVYSMNLP